MNNLTFACTALVGTTKVGKITPDANGYYDLILGALDFDNSYGAQYTYASAQALFKASSSFVRRMNNGYCRAEYGHPKKQPGMSDSDFMMRVMRIDEPMVCAHIKEVRIDPDAIKDKNGRRVIAIRGKVKPTGPYGPALKSQLENPDENVAFSIRSITDDEFVRGKHLKHLREIITWDYVTEPGLSVANKFQAPGLEQFTVASLEELAEIHVPLELLANQLSRPGSVSGCSMESANILQGVVNSLTRERALTAPTATPKSATW